MNKEKIILSIIAILLGLFVAGGAFYLYQMTRTIEEPDNTTQALPTATPTPLSAKNNFLMINEPRDEQVLTKRIVTIKGKTTTDTTIIVSSPNLDQVITPTKNGDFSVTHNLEKGVNLLKITAIFADGKEQTITRTVTSTTEEF